MSVLPNWSRKSRCSSASVRWIRKKREATAQQQASVQYGDHGLVISSPDKQYQLKMRGYIQADSRNYNGNNNNTNVDQFLIRTAQPIVEGKFGNYFDSRLMLDFGNNQTRLLDAYGDFTPYSWANLRIGKFKAPIGLERWESESDTLFVERGMTTNLVPFRDIGFEFFGEPVPQTIEYQLAFIDGGVDLGDTTGDTDNAKDITGRVFTHPFRNSDAVQLQNFGIGAAASYGQRNGSTGNTEVTAGYVTISQAKFFTFTPASGTAYADGALWRFNPELYWSAGPFGLMSEYVYESQQMTNGAHHATLDNTAWLATVSYVLTGEDAAFEGVVPFHNFDPKNGYWGAFEVLARASNLRVDDKTFPFYANLATSAKEAAETTLGFNWYLNYNLKLNADFSRAQFNGGAASGGDRQTEKAFVSRAQFRF